jgi:hypothetical protein
MLNELSQPPQLRRDASPVSQPTPADLLAEIDAECFICKKRLAHGAMPHMRTITREDVFPQWLWKKFRLQNDFIDFPHGESKKYPDILVPCCKTCNNRWLSQVEGRVSKAGKATDQYPEFIKLSRSDVSLWMAKILYGLLAASIKPWDFDSQTPLPPRLSPAVLDQLQLLMKLLDGFRKRVVINAPAHPFSILIFPLKSGSDLHLNFNYRDSPEEPTLLAMRMGSVGIIVSFEDFGHLERWYQRDLATMLAGKVLHPIQFTEVVARALYVGLLWRFGFKYTVIDGRHDVFITLTPQPQKGLDENPQALAAMIARLTRVEKLESLVDGQVRSLLVNDSGDFQDLPFEEGVLYPM